MAKLDALIGPQKYAPLYFLRHGQTAANTEGRIRSWGKMKLDPVGVKMIQAAAEKLKGKGIDCVYASDLPRNKQTGEIVSKALGCELEIRPELRTWKLPFEGQKASAVQKELDYYEKNTDKAPPGGESKDNFYKRSVAFFKEQIQDAKDKPSEGILIVGNGRHAWGLQKILARVRGGDAPDKVTGPPNPGSLLKIDLPSMKVIPVLMTEIDGASSPT